MKNNGYGDECFQEKIGCKFDDFDDILCDFDDDFVTEKSGQDRKREIYEMIQH